VTFILSQAVSLPSNVGKAWPLDNLRMAERWWIA
jgi:peptide/nickel transport system substrate-binding protein